jgi:hypothetical protein
MVHLTELEELADTVNVFWLLVGKSAAKPRTLDKCFNGTSPRRSTLEDLACKRSCRLTSSRLHSAQDQR